LIVPSSSKDQELFDQRSYTVREKSSRNLSISFKGWGDGSNGSGSKNFDPGWVGSIFCGSGQPSMVWVWVWKISTKNVKFFNFFPFGSKNISSGWVKKHPDQRQVSLLFTASQK